MSGWPKCPAVFAGHRCTDDAGHPSPCTFEPLPRAETAPVDEPAECDACRGTDFDDNEYQVICPPCWKAAERRRPTAQVEPEERAASIASALEAKLWLFDWIGNVVPQETIDEMAEELACIVEDSPCATCDEHGAPRRESDPIAGASARAAVQLATLNEMQKKEIETLRAALVHIQLDVEDWQQGNETLWSGTVLGQIKKRVAVALDCDLAGAKERGT